MSSSATQPPVGKWKDYSGPPVTITVWMYPQDDPSLYKAEGEAFHKKYPNITVKYVVYPEDNYVTKLNTTLQAHHPPDVAIIEDQAWMKAGRVVELTDYLEQWGVSASDLNPGGIGRVALEGDPKNGIYAIGDWMDGNVIVYNKKLFDRAHVPYPSATRSMNWQQYAEVCRKVARPNPNPTKTIYGCSVPDWAFGIWTRWLYGPDGRKTEGYMNSPAEVQAWNLGTKLVREKYAPGGGVLRSLPNGEPDLFAQGRIAMTWSDFTFAKTYKANRIDFGVAPFPVIEGSPSFVDTWTAAWGTFTESPHKQAALQYLKFIATDAQRIVVEKSFIPPLNTKVAAAAHYGRGNPIEQQFLTVLRQAKRQVFIPPMGEGGYNSGDIYTKMTVQGKTDAKPFLDDAARKTQPLLDRAWKQWESLGR